MAEFKSMMTDLKVMTRVQRAAAGIAAPPPVHGANKGVDPNLNLRNRQLGQHQGHKPLQKVQQDKQMMKHLAPQPPC